MGIRSFISRTRPGPLLAMVVMMLGVMPLGQAADDRLGQARLAMHLGDLVQAATLLDQEVKDRERRFGPSHIATATAQTELAAALLAQGRLTDALGLVEAAEASTRGLKSSDGEVRALRSRVTSQRIRVLGALGQLARQLTAAESQHRDHLAQYGERSPLSIAATVQLGEAYLALGRQREAMDTFRMAQHMSSAVWGPRHLRTLEIAEALSQALDKEQDLVERLSIDKLAAEVRTEVFGPRHPSALTAQLRLSANLRKRGDTKQSVELAEQVLAIRREDLGDQHPDTARARYEVGLGLRGTGRLDLAVTAFDQALAGMRTALGDLHPDTLRTMLELARTRINMRQLPQAMTLAPPYVTGVETVRGQPGLSGESRRAVFAEFAAGYRLFSVLHGSAGQPEQALKLAEMSKARTLLESMATQRAGRSGAIPATEQARLDELNAQVNAFDQLVGQAVNVEARQALEASRNDVVRRYELLQSQLRERFPKYGQLSQARIATASEIVQTMPKGTVAISYVVGPQSVGAFVVNGEGRDLEFKELGAVKDLADAVEIVRRASAYVGGLKELRGEEGRSAWRLPDGRFLLLDSSRSPPAGAQELLDVTPVVRHLSDRLIKPLEPLLRGRTDWVVSPDGALAQLPFELLGMGGQRLLEQVDLHYAQSLSVYVLAKARQLDYTGLTRTRDLLAVGNPDYESTSESARTRKARMRGMPTFAEEQLKDTRVSWAPLPGTEAEIQALKGVFPNSEALLRSDATEERLQQISRRGELKTYRYLHFAVHGNLSTQDPALSSLVLSQRNLAEGTDGYVTAAEWPGYDLRSDLTVLSACETGLGDNLSGEGVMGLPFALFIAGNVNTVLSLWPVFDDVTPVFMEKFFRRLKAGVPAAKALSQTKRELASDPKTRHPVNWAPFILVGAG